MAARRLVLDRSLAKSDVAQAGMAARRVKIRIRGAAFNRMYAESPALVLKMDALSFDSPDAKYYRQPCCTGAGRGKKRRAPIRSLLTAMPRGELHSIPSPLQSGTPDKY